jgi:sugar-phosphatase
LRHSPNPFVRSPCKSPRDALQFSTSSDKESFQTSRSPRERTQELKTIAPAELTGQALLLDLDGTLLDTTAAVEAAWHRVADQLGVDRAAFRPFMHGIPANQVLDQVVPWLGPADRSRLADQVLADQARDDAPVIWMPGAAHLVDGLARLTWAVVTSGTRRLAESSMRKAGMAAPRLMVTADDVGVGKPDPAPFLRAAQLLKTSPADCICIEDSPAGVTSARRAGMRVVAVSGTFPAARVADADLVLDALPTIQAGPDGRFTVAPVRRAG